MAGVTAVSIFPGTPPSLTLSLKIQFSIQETLSLRWTTPDGTKQKKHTHLEKAAVSVFAGVKVGGEDAWEEHCCNDADLNKIQLFLTSGKPLKPDSPPPPWICAPLTVQLITTPAFEGQNAHTELFRNRHHGSDF